MKVEVAETEIDTAADRFRNLSILLEILTGVSTQKDAGKMPALRVTAQS
jgi:hypothetical protein